MSGLIVEFNGRGFWDKRNFDVWYEHLARLIKSSEDMPQWAIDWADDLLFKVAETVVDFTLMSALNVLTDTNRVALVVELSHKLINQLENREGFLSVEQQKLPSLKTFGTLFIRLLTGENWKRAYFNSYAESFFVAAIDTLSQWVAPDEIGLTHATGLTRYSGSWLFWVSPSNPDAYIEDLPYKGQMGHHICHGIPDLLIEKSGIEDEPEYDALYLEVFLEDKLREQWMLDFGKRITLLLSTENGGYTKRYAADADMYSPALQRTVNLSAIYQARL